jgi:hypothetical protein
MKHSDIKKDMPMMKKVAGIEATKVVNKHEKKCTVWLAAV